MRRQALLLVLVLGVLVLFYASPASASKRMILAQDPSPAESVEGSDKDASQEETADDEEKAPAEEEAGPVWTYQMSKIVIGALILMALGIGGAYYSFVAKRQKEGY